MKDYRRLSLIEVCILSLAIFILTCTSLLAFPAQNADEERLRNLTERFFTAYRDKNLNELMRLWNNKSPDYPSNKKNFEENFSAVEKIELRSLQINKIKIDGEKASVRVVADINAVEPKMNKAAVNFGKLYRTLEWTREEGQWKVWRYVSGVDELAEAVIAAKTEEERKTLLAENSDLVTPDLVSGLIKQSAQINNYSQALFALQLALELAKKMEYKAGIATALYRIGSIYSLQGRYKQALENLLESLNLSKEIGEKEIFVRSVNSIANTYLQQGNSAKSFEYFQQALKLAEDLNDKSLISSILNGIGLFYKSQNDFTLALEYFQRSIKWAEEVGNKRAVAAALSNIGVIHKSQGNYLRSLEFYQKCLKLTEELNDKNGISRTLNNISNVHKGQGNYQQALEYAQKSLKLAEELEDKSSISRSLGSIGNIYYEQYQHEKALEYYQKSLKISEELDNKRLIAISLDNIGIVHYERGNYQQALESCGQSLKIAEQLNDGVRIAHVLANLAKIYLEQGKYQMALDTAALAEARAAQIGIKDVLRRARTTEGKAYSFLNKPDLARQAFVDAIAVTEQLRNQIAGGEQDQQRFFEDKVDPYYQMVALLISENNSSEALAYSERAKGRVLLDVLRNGRINITKAMSSEEQETERTLNEKIVSLNAQLQREKQQPNRDRLSELDTQLQKARLEYELFQTNLYAAHPELKLHRGQTQSLTLNQISNLFPDTKTAILDFVVADNKVYLFLITENDGKTKDEVDHGIKLASHIIDISERNLNERVTAFRNRVAEGNLKFRDQSRELYDLFLKPVEEHLRGKTTICIIPDGALWELPFQALQSKDGRFFIEDHALFLAPSLSALYEMVKKRTRLKTEQAVNADVGNITYKKGAASDVSLPEKSSISTELVAFGNPALNAETVEIIKSVYRDEKIGPLPEAEREVKTLAQIYGQSRSLVFTGAGATETNFKKNAYNARILHFATHGLLDDRNPMYSRIMLARVPEDANEDGMLEAREILNMDLKADMVVLSACQTARGRIGWGEGVIGMSWALFVAGVPSTVVSQWKVESSSATELMIDFYKNLVVQKKQRAAKMTKAEALRLAALKLLRSDKYKHPVDWAGFVLIGDGF